VTSHHALLTKKEKEKENTKLENKREEIGKHLKSTLANSDNHDHNIYLP